MGLASTPAYWEGARWIVQSQTALSDDQLRRIGAWLRKVQVERRVGLRPGAMRDECDETIRALDEGRIVCGVREGGDVFRASQGTGKIISLGRAA